MPVQIFFIHFVKNEISDLFNIKFIYFFFFYFSYVPIGQNRNSFTFLVPLQGCGSIRACAVCDSVENVLIIQNDEDVQSQWDTARKVSCSRTGIEEEKRIFFKPFVIDMLDVVTVPTSSGGVDCWMDIQRGIYPKINPIGDVIKIGEELSVMVYLRDERNEYDVAVRNCYAYDSEEFDDKNTGKVQLSDVSGCSMLVFCLTFFLHSIINLLYIKHLFLFGLVFKILISF